MATSKYNSLEELRRKKALVESEVSDMERLLKFKNPKQSLSMITNGFTDNFLTEKKMPTGETKLSVQTSNIAREIGRKIMTKAQNNSVINMDNTGLQDEIVHNSFRVGGTSLINNGISYIRNLAVSNMKSKSWKKKLISLALIYLLPVILRNVRKRLETYQRRKSLSSIHKII